MSALDRLAAIEAALKRVQRDGVEAAGEVEFVCWHLPALLDIARATEAIPEYERTTVLADALARLSALSGDTE